jgi:EAL and modified HD-GYP domain-containing signal transduction protein
MPTDFANIVDTIERDTMAASDILLIHPLLGKTDAWSGYLVDGELQPGGSGEAIRCLIESQLLGKFNSQHPWLIQANLLDPANHALDQRIIPQFSAADKPDGTNAKPQPETGFREAKRQLAVKVGPRDKLPATGAWDYLLIGVGHARTLPPYSLLGLSSRTIVVATDIQTHGDHHWAKENYCSLHTTEFLLTRVDKADKADITRVKLLKILALIAADADTASLDEVLRHESKLSYSLLRLVNSAANALRTPITSISQAINLLGRRQLQRWVQLLVYADPNNAQQPNPLLQKAAARGRLMEILSSRVALQQNIEILGDEAFMVGSFSLLDVLLHMSIGEVVQQLTLPDSVKMALLGHRGVLGQLLKLVIAAETRDTALAASLLGNLPLSAAEHVEAQLEALIWAEKVNVPGEAKN